MIRLFQLLILLFIFPLSFNSQAQNAELTLSMSDSSLFTFSLGDKQYSTPGTVAVIQDIPAGTYKLKVVKRMRLGNSLVEKPAFDNEIYLEAGRHIEATINQYNQLIINGNSAKNDENSNWNNRGRTRDFPTTGFEGMEAGQFHAFIGNLRDIPNERKRFESAKGRISLSTINSFQLKQIMEEFNDEDFRIRIAVESYSRVTDPSLFTEVYSALRHPSSIRRLNRQLNRIQN